MGSALSVSWMEYVDIHSLHQYLKPSTLGAALFAVGTVPVLYHFYYFTRYMFRLRKIAKAVNQFPGEPIHWLYGTFKDVSLLL